MSKRAVTPLHIEWTPGWVQAVNIVTGECAGGATLAELTPMLSKYRHAVVGVGRKLVFLKALRLPKAAPEDLRRILQAQIAQFFPLPPNQLAYDCLQSDDMTPEGCLTVVAAIRAEDLKRLHAELQQVGITPTQVLPISLGSAAVALRAGYTDAIVVEGSPAGFALDVVQGGYLRFSRLAPRDSDVLCEAQRTQAAAGAGNLPIVTTAKDLIPEALPAKGTALELLQEVGEFHFVLEAERTKETKKRVAARTRLAFLMLASAVLLDVLVWADRSDAQAKIQRGAAAWTRQLTQLRSTRTSETNRAQKVGAIQATLTRAYHPGQTVSDLMSIAGEALPPEAWLTGISIERGKPLQIRGTAKNPDDVSRYVTALGATNRFRDVKLVFANSAKIDDKIVVQFNVTAFGVGNVPMPAPLKQAGRSAKQSKSTKSLESSVAGEQK